VRRYNTTRLRGSTQLSGSTQSLGQSKWDHQMRKMECIIRWMIRWYDIKCRLSTSGHPKYLPQVTPFISATPDYRYAPIAQSVSIISIALDSCCGTVLYEADGMWWWETDFPATTPPWPGVGSTLLLFDTTVYTTTRKNMI
jgi:hypothetical protein